MPRRVITLPPTIRGAAALAFAAAVRRRGADLLELRTDLHSEELPIDALAAELGLLVSERGRALPTRWIDRAVLVDHELGSSSPPISGSVRSHHAALPMSTDDAVMLWGTAKLGDAAIKHVEPVGSLDGVERLFETQAQLRARFGPQRVTVLAMGPLASAFRARLAGHNALDYLSADHDWSAAPGQRLLDDAVRADRAPAGTPRLAILGSRIGEARSPRIHPPPFDRIDVPADTDVAALLPALLPGYRGLAVTSPFKRSVARAIGCTPGAAVNTLVRSGDRWIGHNTDVAGARRVLDALDAPEVCVLGDGGVTGALREAAAEQGRRLRVVTRAVGGERIGLPAVWTWPEGIDAPASLAFSGGPVAIVAYGRPARAIADEIRRRGGEPVAFGPGWLVAQARAQRLLWGLS